MGDFWKKTKGFFGKIGNYYKENPVKAIGLTLLIVAGVAGVIAASVVTFGAAPAVAAAGAATTFAIAGSPAMTAAAIGVFSGVTAAAGSIALTRNATNPATRARIISPGKRAEKLANLSGQYSSRKELEDRLIKAEKAVKLAEKNLQSNEKAKNSKKNIKYLQANADLALANKALAKIRNEVTINKDPTVFAENLLKNAHNALQIAESMMKKAKTKSDVKNALILAQKKIMTIEQEIVSLSLTDEQRKRFTQELAPIQAKLNMAPQIRQNEQPINHSIHSQTSPSNIEVQPPIIINKEVSNPSITTTVPNLEAQLASVDAELASVKEQITSLNEELESIEKARTDMDIAELDKISEAFDKALESLDSKSVKPLTKEQLADRALADEAISSLMNALDKQPAAAPQIKHLKDTIIDRASPQALAAAHHIRDVIAEGREKPVADIEAELPKSISVK